MTAQLSTQATGNAGAWPVAFIQSGCENLSATFSAWRERTARRRAAIAIDNHTLADIGLIRAQIDHEAGKPFWRA